MTYLNMHQDVVDHLMMTMMFITCLTLLLVGNVISIIDSKLIFPFFFGLSKVLVLIVSVVSFDKSSSKLTDKSFLNQAWRSSILGKDVSSMIRWSLTDRNHLSLSSKLTCDRSIISSNSLIMLSWASLF